VLRSWHDRPLALSNVELQANPAEAAADARMLQAYPVVSDARRADVIFIYLDGLRADILGSYGGSMVRMPFVEGLLASGALQQVNETWATCSTTLCGLTAMLQSRPAHRVHPGNLSIQKVLAKQGWQIRYLLGGDHQNFLMLKDFYGPRFDFYLDGVGMDPARATDDRLLLEHLHRLPRSAPGAPQFIMFALMSTHAIGVRGLDFRRYKPDEISGVDFGAVKQEAIGVYRNYYRNGVLQADHVLERIWKWLGEQGYLETAVIVITSDHGELLGEHGAIGHSRSLSTPELRIPWWIRVPPALASAIGPRATQLADAHNYSYQTDVAPTILDLLGLPLPESWTGQSLLRPREPRALPLYFPIQQNLYGLVFDIDGRPWKYLNQRDRGSDGFYDLRADPLDQRDQAAHLPPALVQQVRSQVELTFAARMAAHDIKAAEKAAQRAAEHAASAPAANTR
jgi:glucan phosphoethanolaminetransferase (alkaline phosphatase superfamily)